MMRSLTRKHFLLAVSTALFLSIASVVGCSSANLGVFADAGDDGTADPVATGTMTEATTGTLTATETATTTTTGTSTSTSTVTTPGTGTTTATMTVTTTATMTSMDGGADSSPMDFDSGHAPPVDSGHSPPVDSGHFPPEDSGHSPPEDSGHPPPVDSGDGAMDAGPPTFTNIYTTIFPYCIGCHAGGQGGLTLSSQAKSYSDLVNVRASSCSGDLVVPGKAATSVLYEKVADTNPPCGNQMPINGPYLTPAQLNVIETWINDGAKNN